ncbi:ead/Ea22-like family protein [Escherichia coli]|nr:ead/Ea22-like family protein [Escherichia coli]
MDYQALRGATQNAKDLGGIKKYKRGEQAVAEFESLITPHIVLALLDEREAQSKRIAELEANLSAMTEDHQKATESIKQADAAVKLAHETFSALAAENAKLKKFCKDAEVEGLIKAVRFYEQVKREKTPVETGAWKDAVDWVLKEACQAVHWCRQISALQEQENHS